MKEEEEDHETCAIAAMTDQFNHSPPRIPLHQNQHPPKIVYLGFLAEVDFFPHISHGHLLGRGHDQRPVDAGALEVLHDAQVLVGGARRRVYNQKVELPPVHVLIIHHGRWHNIGRESSEKKEKHEKNVVSVISRARACTVKNCLMRPFLRGPRQMTASSLFGSIKPTDITISSPSQSGGSVVTAMGVQPLPD